jgi:hypothetical protein
VLAFIVTPQTAKVPTIVHDKDLVNIKKAFNYRIPYHLQFKTSTGVLTLYLLVIRKPIVFNGKSSHVYYQTIPTGLLKLCEI